MRNLFKKSLTLCLVAILAFSCFAGIVSAENPFTATIAVENQTITPGTTSVDVVLDIDSSQIGINEALIEVSSDIGTIDVQANLGEYTTANNEKASIVYPGDSTNYGSFYLSVADDLTTDPSTMGSLSAATITVTFTVDKNKAVGTYPINIKVDGVRAASGDEDVIKFTYEEANISVVAPHVHEYKYTPNEGDTHTYDCSTCENFDPVTEACTLENGACIYCLDPQEEVEPETFTVTFVDSDGTTVLKTEEVAPNGAATAPEVADDDANNTYFVGWDKEFSNITEDTTVTAKYTSLTIRLKQASLVLGGEILINYYVVPEIGDLKDSNVKEFGILAWEKDTFNSEDWDYDVNFAFPATEKTELTDKGYAIPVSRYSFEMNDTLYTRAYVILNNGTIIYGKKKTTVSGVDTYPAQDAIQYSVVTYANNMLGKSSTDAKLKDTLVSMVNYGAAAQIYFADDKGLPIPTGNELANHILDESQKVIPTAVYGDLSVGNADPDAVSTNSAIGDVTNSRIRQASLILDSVVSINYYVNLANESKTIEKVSILSWNADDYTANENNLIIDNASFVTEAEYNGSNYVGNSLGIYAHKLREYVYARAYIEYADGSVGYTRVFKYSAEYYAKSKSNDSNQYLATLTNALMDYADKAKAYDDAN